MNFAQALSALKKGEVVRRVDWDKGCFVFVQVPSVINKEIVPKMQSVPASAKKVFEKRFEDPIEQVDSLHYCNQFAFVDASCVVHGWSPSPQDCFSELWEMFE